MLVKLYYRTTDYRGFEDFIETRPEYVKVMEFPLVEMTGATPDVWAADFYECAGEAVGIHRLPCPGDMILYADTAYMFVDRDEDIDQLCVGTHEPSGMALIKITYELAETIKMIFELNEGGPV